MLCNDCKETTELMISDLSPELQVSSPPRILQGSNLQIRLFIFKLEKGENIVIRLQILSVRWLAGVHGRVTGQFSLSD